MLLRTWCICGNLALAFKKAGYLRGDPNIRLSSLLIKYAASPAQTWAATR